MAMPAEAEGESLVPAVLKIPASRGQSTLLDVANASASTKLQVAIRLFTPQSFRINKVRDGCLLSDARLQVAEEGGLIEYFSFGRLCPFWYHLSCH